ncbi:class I SAM-dependent methyltransferase [Collimonas silvisoli]|uniref:class I SAM-dependent methyltransferase n=1 Tax=Collimonas silvisoli TaxID=2825884 RepID=UPI001E526C72|nr:class I SAM-dependent methyltransferase [Collimonas silvisoli]
MPVPELLRIIAREIFERDPLARTPEPCQIMNEREAVSAYTNGGRQNGALSGAYLYHLAHMCQLVHPGDVVLDLGCGPGNLLGQLAELNPRAEFVGVDLSQPMLDQAAKMLRAKGIYNVELKYADMTTLVGVPDQSIDVAVSSMAFHHLPDEECLDRTFEQIARVLKPNGRVYFNDFGRLRNAESIPYFVGRATEGESQELIDDYYHSLHAAFTKADFERAVLCFLRGRGRVYATVVSPFQVVVKTPGHCQKLLAAKPELKRRFHALPRARKADVRQLSLFLNLGGLRNAL